MIRVFKIANKYILKYLIIVNCMTVKDSKNLLNKDLITIVQKSILGKMQRFENLRVWKRY